MSYKGCFILKPSCHPLLCSYFSKIFSIATIEKCNQKKKIPKAKNIRPGNSHPVGLKSFLIEICFVFILILSVEEDRGVNFFHSASTIVKYTLVSIILWSFLFYSQFYHDIYIRKFPFNMSIYQVIMVQKVVLVLY